MSEEKRILPNGYRPDTRLNKGVLDEPVNELTEYPLTAIEEAVRSIRYGTVQIVIQDGRIVQIEKTEKIRLR